MGALGSARAAAGVLAFIIGGVLGTYIGWRPAFGILIAVSAIVFLLSFRLKRDYGRPDVQIDVLGVVLAASAIILISFGFNNLNGWGVALATANAPFDLLGLSPAPVMIVLGVVLGQAFLMWTHRRQAAGKTPLLALEVIDSPEERSAVYALFAVVALEAALNFSVPLYIQIVQGRSPLATAIAMMPFNLTVFFTAMLIVNVYERLTPRQIGRYGFMLCTIGLVWLAFVVRNDWSEIPVLLGLVLFGIGQGSLVTLLFNVLVTASPKEQAGDVGSLRGTTQNLAAAVGTALAGALLVGLLSTIALSQIAANPALPKEIQSQVDLDNITFVSNDRLRSVMEGTTATPQQVEEAVRVNTEARLRALKIGLLIMAGLALLAIIPAGRLPNYLPGRNTERCARQPIEVGLTEYEQARRGRPDKENNNGCNRSPHCAAEPSLRRRRHRTWSRACCQDRPRRCRSRWRKISEARPDDFKQEAQAVATRPPGRPRPPPSPSSSSLASAAALGLLVASRPSALWLAMETRPF